MNKLTLATLLFSGLFIFNSCTEKDPAQSNEVNQTSTISDTSAINSSNNMRIAFVYGDSINSKYQFIKDAEVELQKQQKVFEERVNNKMKRAETRYRELMGQAQTMTQEEMQAAQAELQQLDVDMQKYQEELAIEYRTKETDLQKDYVNRIQKYLEVYNEEHNYDYIVNYQTGGQILFAKDAFNITPEVIEGLNSAYTAELKDAEKVEK